VQFVVLAVLEVSLENLGVMRVMDVTESMARTDWTVVLAEKVIRGSEENQENTAEMVCTGAGVSQVFQEGKASEVKMASTDSTEQEVSEDSRVNVANEVNAGNEDLGVRKANEGSKVNQEGTLRMATADMMVSQVTMDGQERTVDPEFPVAPGRGDVREKEVLRVLEVVTAVMPNSTDASWRR